MRTTGRLAIIAIACVLLASCEAEAPAPEPKNRVKELLSPQSVRKKRSATRKPCVSRTASMCPGPFAVDADGKPHRPGDMALQLRAAYEKREPYAEVLKTDFDTSRRRRSTRRHGCAVGQSKLRFELLRQAQTCRLPPGSR